MSRFFDNSLRPFFSYHGAKYRAVKYYPRPIYPVIREPFAGSACFSLRYPHLKVHLYDISAVVCGLWEYLIRVKESEIRSLPLIVGTTDNLDVCEEAKWLIGFWLNKGTAHPCKKPSKWCRGGTRPHSYWGESVRGIVASQVSRIRHWKVTHQHYKLVEIGNIPAVWFVDPPYSNGHGQNYRHNRIGYDHLGKWCYSLPGQVIVCEKQGATWLPFENQITLAATRGKNSKTYSHETFLEIRNPWTSSYSKNVSPASTTSRSCSTPFPSYG